MDREKLARTMYRENRAGATLTQLARVFAHHYTGKRGKPTRGWAAKLVWEGKRLIEAEGPGNVVAFPSPPPTPGVTYDSKAARDAAPDSFEQVLKAHADRYRDDDAELEVLLDIAERLNEIKERRDPKFSHVEYNVEDSGPIAIMFASCAHLGGRYTDHESFRRLMDAALEIPGLYIAPLGDDIDGFHPDFIDRTSILEQALNLDQQVNLLQRLLAKWARAERALFGMASQHGGDWLARRYGHNPIKELYRTYGLPWFDGQGYLKIRVGEQVYNVAVAHEFPGSSQYNQLHAQTRAHRFQFPNADVIVQGDKHVYAYEKATSYVWEYMAGNRLSPYVHYLQVGTAKTGLDTYTMRRWSQGIFEWPILVFGADDHTIRATDSLEDVINWLPERPKHPSFTWAVTGLGAPEESEHVPGQWKARAIRGAKQSGSHGAAA